MRRKRIIRKLLMLAAWMLVVAGMCTLLVAANRRQQSRVCKRVRVAIEGKPENFYIEKEDVLKLVEGASKGSLLRRSIADIDLKALEAGLKTNPWIRKARLFFDNRDELHIVVEERDPVARIFTKAGTSFYIDSGAMRMPLVQKIAVRLPMITGFTPAIAWSARDSALLKAAKDIAAFIYSSDFWNAQVGEISIMPDSSFELVPVVGDHRIKLGDGSNIEDKLDRLLIFYKQVMSKTGFSKYSELNLSFDGQVVAVRRSEGASVDSARLKRNIEILLQHQDTTAADQVSEPPQMARGGHDSSGEHEAMDEDSVAAKPELKTTAKPTALKAPQPKKAEIKKQEAKREEVKKMAEKQTTKPKAVLRRKPDNEY